MHPEIHPDILTQAQPCREKVTTQLREIANRFAQYSKATSFIADMVDASKEPDIEPAVYDFLQALRMWELGRK